MRFTIICPVYNSEVFLEKTLNSLCMQKYSDYEIVCIDDGSTDKSLEILQNFANQHKRIVLHTQTNQGPSAARNIGLSLAKGEYIMFCDSDDWFERDTILLELDAYISKQDKEVDVVYFPGNTNWDGNTETSPNYNEEVFKTGWDLCSTYCEYKSFLFFGAIYAFCYRRELIIKNKITFTVDIKYGEDRIWVFDVLDKANFSIVYSKPCYFYNVRTNSLMTDKKTNIKRLQDALKVAEILWDKTYTLRKTQNIKRYIAKFHFSSIKNFLFLGIFPKVDFNYKIKLICAVSTFPQLIKLLLFIFTPKLYKKILVSKL